MSGGIALQSAEIEPRIEAVVAEAARKEGADIRLGVEVQNVRTEGSKIVIYQPDEI